MRPYVVLYKCSKEVVATALALPSRFNPLSANTATARRRTVRRRLEKLGKDTAQGSVQMGGADPAMAKAPSGGCLNAVKF